LPVLGVGGTIRNIGRIHRRVVDYPLEITHNYRMCEDEVARICHMTAKMNLEERKNLKGLSKGRTDIFVGASQAVYKVMQTIFLTGADHLRRRSAGWPDFQAFRQWTRGSCP
ncbi:exopolyphosphatase, partial [Eubacterium callanderi]|nr:exopolyphosphatase [Eubacterium callanderi]